MAGTNHSSDFDAVTKGELEALLWGWIKGEVEEGVLVDFADERLPREEIDIDDDRRPVYVVLDALSTIFAQPLTREDAFVLLHYLRLWERDPEYYEAALQKYWEEIVNWEGRVPAADSGQDEREHQLNETVLHWLDELDRSRRDLAE